jgi:subtilisin-like proprotein convertase family protein
MKYLPFYLKSKRVDEHILIVIEKKGGEIVYMNCACHTLKHLCPGQTVVLIVGGQQIPFTLLSRHQDCVTGRTTGNRVITLSCKCICGVLCSRCAVNTATFTNPEAITIPDSGTATPYPSTIAVAGLTGSISNVTVTIRGLTHTFLRDLQILLVGPAGQNVYLMGDVGNSNPGVVNATYTFSDSAASFINPFVIPPSGTYKPSNDGSLENLPAPAPQQPPAYGTTLSVFNGTNPNGTWQLYVFDDAGSDQGVINNGWQINISTLNCI